METLNKEDNRIPRLLMITGILLLVAGILFGLTGALQYVMPGFLKTHLSFEKIRPLHVSSVVFWIIITSMGAVLSYLKLHTGQVVSSHPLLKVMFPLLIATILTILVSYCYGMFGGREYWEFHPVLSIPIIICWVLYLVVFIKMAGNLKKQPVYVWMWFTGVVFFLFTFLESYLWVFPYFRNHIVNDMTIQWKSYGSMVGSWNMLIYGCSIFLMDKISGDKHYGFSKIAFTLYFIGLFNLMFNWGHHIYTLPTHNYVKYISYAVSMTELLIIGRIIYTWKSSLSTAKKYFYATTYRFLAAADAWVFLTLALAIVMSVPAINLYTHGTHITVAHTMGATIGINSMLLLAVSFDVLAGSGFHTTSNKRMVHRGYWLTNISLFFFWITLIVAGIWKARWQMDPERTPFGTMMEQLQPAFMVFLATGLLLVIGLLMITLPLLKHQLVSSGERIQKFKTQYYN